MMSIVRALFAGLMLATAASAWCQASNPTITPSTAGSRTSAPKPPLTATTPSWVELNKLQQEALEPLAKTWNTLSETHRRKWISIALTYPSLTPENKQKLHSRMAEWTALTPRARELARLNFAETKKLAPGERTANWEAYQALSAEQRNALAAQATKKPTGAAIAIKPDSADKLATVPVTRLTSPVVRKEATAEHHVNPKTLLPRGLSPVQLAPPALAALPANPVPVAPQVPAGPASTPESTLATPN